MNVDCSDCYDRLVGVAEIAEMAHVSPQCVNNWRARHVDFPRPVKTLRMGPLFDCNDVAEWLAPRVVERPSRAYQRNGYAVAGSVRKHKVVRGFEAETERIEAKKVSDD